MPSPKDPVSTILPGPGKASDGTVSASALDFDPSVGPQAALAAHIAAAPAHDDSAISSGPFLGTFWQTGSTTTAEAILEQVYNGLNARGVLTLDANPLATDADFVGISAITSAIGVGGNNILFCRPGTYDWPAATPSNITIIGGNSPQSGLSGVFLQNAAGDINVGSGVTLTNVTLSCSGNVNIGSTGAVSFDAVYFAIGGGTITVANNGAGCTFRRCRTSGIFGAGIKLVDSGSGGNVYEALKIEQVDVQSARNTFLGLIIAGPGTPPTPSSPLLKVSGNDNSFTSTSITHSGAAISSNALAVDAGLNNTFRGVVIPSLNTSAEAVKFTTGASSNRIDNLRISSTTCTHVVSLLSGSRNRVSNVTVGTTTVTGGNNVINIQSQSHIVEAVSIFTTTGVGKIVSIAGSDCFVSNISATAVAPTISFLVFESGSFDNRVERWTQAITPYVGSGPLFHIQGTGNSLNQMELDTVTTLAQPMIRFNGAVNCVARTFILASCGVTAGAGFQLCRFNSSTGCKAGDISINSTTTTIATTSGLVQFAGATACEFDGLSLSNAATSGAINSPILLAAAATANTRCVFRNVTSSLTSYAAGTVLLDIDQDLWNGLLIENVSLTDQYAGGVPIRLRTSGSLFGSSNLPIVVTDCDFSNSNSSSSHGVWATNFGDKAIFERCNFQVGGGTSSSTVTISVASPTVIGWVSHGLVAGSQIVFTTTGSLPTPLSAGIPYWVLSTGLTANSFQISATPDGTAINTTLAGSGTHTATRWISAVKVDNSWHLEFKDCNIVGSGSSVITASVLSAGAKFRGCVFWGPGGGTSGTQLFQGYGYAGGSTATYPQEPLVIEDCTFRPGGRNNSPNAVTNPMILIGGLGSTVVPNHGACIIDGLRLVKSSSFSTWHRSPLLSLDASDQAPGTQSSFSNIVIDLEGAAFGTGGGGGSILPTTVDLNGADVVVEVAGDNLNTTVQKTPLRNLKLVGLPRNGGTGAVRSAFFGSALNMSDCVIDASPGAASDWNSATVAVRNCHVTNLAIYPTTSLPLGTGIASGVLWSEASKLDRVVIDHFEVNPAEQRVIVGLNSSSLSNSRIDMQDGSHLPVPASFGYMIAMFNDSSGEPCILSNNVITYSHQGQSSGDVRQVVVCGGNNNIITNNYFRNLAEAGSGSYGSNGGGCQIEIDAENVICNSNTLLYEWQTGADVIHAIRLIGGNRAKIIGNTIHNSATPSGNQGGTTGIQIQSGLYSNVSNNHIIGDNTNASPAASRVLIDTSGAASSIVMGNSVDNFTSTGAITAGAGDIPTPAGSFNKLN